MITLRENQVEAVEKAISFFQQKKKTNPSLMVLPTAWGKSILIGWVAYKLKEKVLVIQPSKELLEQNFNKYFDLCQSMEKAAVYSASFNSKEIGHITFATIGSIKNKASEFKEMGVTRVLIDEAHMYPREDSGMLRTFIKQLKPKHVLGVTATPFKLQTNTDINGNPFSKLVCLTNRSKKGTFFKEIIHVSQIQEMVQMKFWSPLKYVEEQIDDSFLEYNSTKAEFTDFSIERTYEKNNIKNKVEVILEKSEKEYNRSHILVFVPSIKIAIEMQQKLGGGVIYSGMKDKDRQQVISDFKNGKITKLFNVRILSVGFDYPGIDAIIIGYSTASLTNYYQIIGRGTRITPRKKDCLIFDLGGNYTRFGKVEDLRMTDATGQWELVNDSKLVTSVPIHLINAPYVMPFGKYKGQEIQNIPDNYLNWLIENADLGVVLSKQIKFTMWNKNKSV